MGRGSIDMECVFTCSTVYGVQIGVYNFGFQEQCGVGEVMGKFGL